MAQLTIGSNVAALVPFLDTLGAELATPTVNGHPVTYYFGNASGTSQALQLSTTQVAIEYPESQGNLFLLVQGTGLSMPLTALDGNPNLSDVQGTVTSAQLYSGGSFGISMGVGTHSGGTEVGSATFSSTRYTVTAGNTTVTLNGSGLPTNAGSVAAMFQGTYVGPNIGVSSVQYTEGSTTVTIALSATTLTITSGAYELTLTGSFPTSLSDAQIDTLLTGNGSLAAGLSGDITGATVTATSDSSTVLAVTGLSGSGIPLTDFKDTGLGSPLLSLLASLLKGADGNVTFADSGASLIDTAMTLSAGQTDFGDVVTFGLVGETYSAGNEIVGPDARSIAALVANGGTVTVSGGTTIGTDIMRGGNEVVSASGTQIGSSYDAIVENGGIQIAETGVASNTVVKFGGLQSTFLNGGTDDTDVKSGGIEIVGGFGYAGVTTLESGAILEIGNSGIASGAVVESGAWMLVESAGSALDPVLMSGGTLYVVSGATVEGAVSSGGSVATATVIPFHLGTSETSGLIGIGAFELVSGGLTSGDSVYSGGKELVEGGGAAVGTLVEAGGLLFAGSDGGIYNTIVGSGDTCGSMEDTAAASSFRARVRSSSRAAVSVPPAE